MHLTGGFRDLAFRMLSKLKIRYFLRNAPVASAVESALMLLLLVCGLVVMTRHFGENTDTDSNHVANAASDESFHATSPPYSQGGRFEPVQY